MTSPSKYRLVFDGVVPEIVVSLREEDGPTLTWREAKKELRQWYLNKAKSLRPITEKSYFE